jgi:putative nucleotidyltransferase with HDIG domain
MFPRLDTGGVRPTLTKHMRFAIMDQLDQYLDQVKALPPAPAILSELLRVLQQPDADMSQVVDLVAYDPSLTAAVLKLCNSAYFASDCPAENLYEAISRIGFYEVYRLVAAIIGSRTLSPSQPGYGLKAGELWKHAVTTAVATQQLADHLGEETNSAFTAALLHDLGKIILAQAMETHSAQVLQTLASGRSFFEAEQAVLGMEHAAMGGRLLTRWHFPDKLIRAVSCHHDPGKAPSDQRLAALVHLGDVLAHYIGEAYGTQPFAFHGRPEALEILGLHATDLEQHVVYTVEGLEAVAGLMLKAA